MAVTRAGRNTDTGAFGIPEAGDFLNIDAHLSEEEIGVRERVRSFVHERIKSNIKGWYHEAVFPKVERAREARTVSGGNDVTLDYPPCAT
jgi:hypothetical protein